MSFPQPSLFPDPLKLPPLWVFFPEKIPNKLVHLQKNCFLFLIQEVIIYSQCFVPSSHSNVTQFINFSPISTYWSVAFQFNVHSESMSCSLFNQFPVNGRQAFFFYYTFYFEIIVESHAVVRNDTKRFPVPFPQFPPG